MRGKAVYPFDGHCSDGITPAYAGKSCPVLRNRHGVEDHPRLCGEKPAFSSLVRFQPGSPPPMRGKVLKLPPYFFVDQDHPRLCGEKKMRMLQM